MTKFRIKSRLDSSKVVFECELTAEIAEKSYSFQLGFAVREAIKASAYLKDANLKDADLEGAYLRGTYLTGADLEGANLKDANLKDANLRGANLTGAYLTGANLKDANFKDANLKDANLRGTYLTGAYLTGADLEGANLKDAYLDAIKGDFFGKLAAAKNEALALYDYLMKGRINGSVYEGECACFMGTLAKIRGENYREMGIDLRPDSDCPAERWFLAIRKGDTPQNNQVSAITAEWMREFMDKESIKYPKYEIVAIQEKKDD